LRRCVGRTCPKVKKVERILGAVFSNAIRQNPMRQHELVGKTDIVATKRPAVVARIEGVSKREGAPDERVVKTADTIV